jgi:FMN phosphatase YigB (HAD superfamily)
MHRLQAVAHVGQRAADDHAHGVVEIGLASSHRGVPLYLLSNAPGFLDRWLRGPAQAKHPFVGRFRDFIVSGHVGCWKPDAAIFELICRTGGFSPQGCSLHR